MGLTAHNMPTWILRNSKLKSCKKNAPRGGEQPLGHQPRQNEVQVCQNVANSIKNERLVLKMELAGSGGLFPWVWHQNG